jgi:hypothetical protein
MSHDANHDANHDASRDTELIFVSIAAYRDPQLVPTVRDCIAKAHAPERLRFGICWQRGAEETSLPFEADPRFSILEVQWQNSCGACWARAQVMKLWRGEHWFLQVDSHCRFVDGWDHLLLRVAAETGSSKPILSTYATPFTPGEHEVLEGGPLQIGFQAFTPEGIPQLQPVDFPHSFRFNRAVRARFLSAGFLFAPGSFVEEVPYDPELYFMGEETAMTVRAYTHGYDIFHPAQTIIWHDYLRLDAKKHWADHTESSTVCRPWNQLDLDSKQKVQRLLRGELIGGFGLGSVRTLKEYENYAGLSFRHRKAQNYTMAAKEPPNPEEISNWTDRIYNWIVRVTLQRSELPTAALDDPEMWCVCVQDKDGTEISRTDFPPDKLQSLHGNQETVALICEFPSETVPATWTVWPRSMSQGWLRMMRGNFQDGDFAILADEPGSVEQESNSSEVGAEEGT